MLGPVWTMLLQICQCSHCGHFCFRAQRLPHWKSLVTVAGVRLDRFLLREAHLDITWFLCSSFSLLVHRAVGMKLLC